MENTNRHGRLYIIPVAVFFLLAAVFTGYGFYMIMDTMDYVEVYQNSSMVTSDNIVQYVVSSSVAYFGFGALLAAAAVIMLMIHRAEARIISSGLPSSLTQKEEAPQDSVSEPAADIREASSRPENPPEDEDVRIFTTLEELKIQEAKKKEEAARLSEQARLTAELETAAPEPQPPEEPSLSSEPLPASEPAPAQELTFQREAAPKEALTPEEAAPALYSQPPEEPDASREPEKASQQRKEQEEHIEIESFTLEDLQTEAPERPSRGESQEHQIPSSMIKDIFERK
ncbi:MAG TPA: hypothetical protein IAC50_03890 [Candidatus Copromorpha excrementigallinarum]|uniref:Uncharacterized protein n=1 Tax=Candidatus Allocopromorpha excrementigallinarum TaxID=2840742 RepID=A0A9D1I297_9FIRM|nr:hypothetical protein [Candidatus Copromorpha excrementigallinarum]